jgi:hypothetical protein
LGAPRLAHLAALVVFARRAASVGASFRWGVLEDREHRLFENLDEAAVQHWLHARTALAADADAIAAWLDAIGTSRGDDVWFVGGPDDAAVARAAHARTLVVRDVLDPRAQALDVEVDRPGAASRVRLELPPSDDCARLLRDPFRRGDLTRRVTAVTGPATEVRLAPGGRRLLVQLDHGVVESWPIPNSPRDKVGKPQRWTLPRGHSLACVGLAGRRSILAATVSRDDPTVLELSYSSSHHRIRVTVPSYVTRRLATDSTLPVGTCGLVQLREGASADLILDVGGHLLVVLDFKLWPAAGTVLNAVALNPVGADATPRRSIATALHRSSVVWAEHAGGWRIRVVEGTSSGNRTLATLDRMANGPVLFGFSHPAQTSSWGIVAVPRESDEWTVAAAMFNDQRKLLPTASSPIISVAVSSTHPHVAWVTESGEVVLYSMQHDAVLMRRSPEESG